MPKKLSEIFTPKEMFGKRKKIRTMHIGNLLTDHFWEEEAGKDTLGHFINEVILHKDMKNFKKNFIKYRLPKEIIKRLKL